MERLAAEGVDVLNVHHRFCRPRLIECARGKQLRVFTWGIRSTGSLQRAIRLQVDGVYCDNVEMMVQALRQANGPMRDR
jgi:glycerophosphoryl diester phosphodiesterase